MSETKILQVHYLKTMATVFKSKVYIFYSHGESCYWTYSFERIFSICILGV
uniref:Uncharacterized protein n=1 Tax=Bartonella rochalimae ATCC BAA-1498 TaxID=685782 RepID=E6YKF8_9HYPH|nr:hypothetical protein BARRO_20003 [Bartonella rochalimae ATCC BAA-1498]